MLLSTAFFIMLGFGFMYQQFVSIARAKPAYVKLWLDADQQTRNSAPPKKLTNEELSKKVEITRAISGLSSSLDEKDIASFAGIIRKQSEEYNYDWELILAIIKAESEFDARARSAKGARGLMQVMPSTARWLAPKLGAEYGGHDSLYDPEYNVKLGTHYLHMMHQKFGDIEKAIAAYNRGPAGLERYLREGNKFPPEYLVKVMGYYKELKSKSGES